MRFMVLVKANPKSEAGVLPSAEELAEMGKYNEELVKAGIMLAGEGLHPTSKGARGAFDGKGTHTVADGPFAVFAPSAPTGELMKKEGELRKKIDAQTPSGPAHGEQTGERQPS